MIKYLAPKLFSFQIIKGLHKEPTQLFLTQRAHFSQKLQLEMRRHPRVCAHNLKTTHLLRKFLHKKSVVTVGQTELCGPMN